MSIERKGKWAVQTKLMTKLGKRLARNKLRRSNVEHPDT